MSINMDSMGEDPTDYSDFEYEQFELEAVIRGGGGTNNLDSIEHFSWDPLQGKGGLDNNEVAELVGSRLTLHIEAEDAAQGSQAQPTHGEARGKFGANLNPGDVIFNNPGNLDAFEADNSNSDYDSADRRGFVSSDNRVFELLQTTYSPAFGDPADGTGGGAEQNLIQFDRNWRAVTGRGPVLDATDDLTVNLRTLVNSSEIVQSTILRGHLIYDTATVDEAGRAFSVPDA